MGWDDCFNRDYVERGTFGLDQKTVHHSCGRINRSFVSLALAGALGIRTHPHIGGVGRVEEGSCYWFRRPQEYKRTLQKPAGTEKDMWEPTDLLQPSLSTQPG